MANAGQIYEVRAFRSDIQTTEVRVRRLSVACPCREAKHTVVYLIPASNVLACNSR
jgi:hypothetical protein